MGWKTFKEKYGISHAVQVSDGCICIGSTYVYDIAKIDMKTGEMVHNRTFADFIQSTYPSVAADGIEGRLAAIQAADKFAASITVYTYAGAEIIEKLCEAPGWPNVTHDGCMMYDNTFSTNKAEVVGWAKSNAAADVEWRTGAIAEAETKFSELSADLTAAEANRLKLDADFPDIEASS